MVLGALVLTLLALIFSQTAFDLPFLRPTTTNEIFLFAALSGLTFLTFVALSFVLVRNLLKLYAERRTGVVGSKFRTKMVWGALLLSVAPVVFMFIFAHGLMNFSLEKWFSRPVEDVREHTEAALVLMSNYAAQNARAEAQAIAASPGARRSFETGNFTGVMEEFRRHEVTLHGGFAVALIDDHAGATFRAPEVWAGLRKKLPPPESKRPLEIAGREYMLGWAPVGQRGRILVALPLPPNFSATMRQIEATEQQYAELIAHRRLIRRTYLGLLLLLTILVLFAATWLALHLSKSVTRPVTALADATREISAGHLDYRVETQATDELGELVSSFNRMAGELESSRRQIETSSRELASANVKLEQRRRHIETIVESIPTGVLSLDAERRVVHANTAMVRIFNPPRPRFKSGAPLEQLFPGEIAESLQHLLRKADRMGMATSQMEVAQDGAKLTLAVTAASLDPAPARDGADAHQAGYVLVFEDLSDLLQAQRQAAWREVAQRVAHEIKNPLTPIALSAERIRRHLDRGSRPDEASLNVIRGCSDTIAGAVETVRALVDEFSSLARFPASQPQPSNINWVIEGALAMFDGRLNDVHVRKFLASDLPQVMADPEAIKRVIANLVDNAVEAMQDSLVREVQISTTLLEGKDAVEIVVADTGHGVTRDLKEKLFLPYFSTKKRGTGLGLAIVSRIIEDHQGSIRVEENRPVGTRFVVELPVVPEQIPAVKNA